MTDENNKHGIREKAYREELENKGSTFTDTISESEAIDRTKIEKAAIGVSQKIDGENPYQDEDTVSDEQIRKETLDKK